MKIGVTSKILLATVVGCFVLACAGKSLACELFLQCKDIERVVVSEGMDFLKTGPEKRVYVVCVDVDATKINLKKFVAECNCDSINVKTGKFSIAVPKRNFPGGQSFCIVRMKPREALNIAGNICQDKVMSFLPE